MINRFFSILVTIILLLNNYTTFASKDDIKWQRWPVIDLGNYLLYQFVIIFLLVWLLIYYRFYVNKEIKVKKIIDEKIQKKKNLIALLNKLKKNIDKYNKSDFYTELNSYFRSYFTILEIENSEILTLKELKSTNIDKKLINLFEKSYYSEFSDKNDDNKIRNELIDQLVKIIK